MKKIEREVKNYIYKPDCCDLLFTDERECKEHEKKHIARKERMKNCPVCFG